MKRVYEKFIQEIERNVSLEGKSILEVGCGSGNYSRQIKKKCHSLIGIDPDKKVIQQAQEKDSSQKESYLVGSATSLDFMDNSFDIVVFTLSFHHVPMLEMKAALQESVRVVRSGGYIIFLEPKKNGSFFEAEILFDAGDGDESQEKDVAYKVLQDSPYTQIVKEVDEKTAFVFESTEDFVTSLKPRRNLEKIQSFLEQKNMTLEAERRIIICTPI